MRRVRMALAAGLVLVLATLGIVLSHAPLTLTGTNGLKAEPNVAHTGGEVTLCQNEGVLPRETSALRVSLSANVGPALAIKVLSGGKIIARGSRPAGWGLAETATVPVAPIGHAVRNVRVCTTIGATPEPLEIRGTVINHVVALRLEYLRVGPSSWWSLASTIAGHMGLGRSPTGMWVAWAAALAMLAVVGLTSRLLLREMR
jgi:hypothetical protein